MRENRIDGRVIDNAWSTRSINPPQDGSTDIYHKDLAKVTRFLIRSLRRGAIFDEDVASGFLVDRLPSDSEDFGIVGNEGLGF